MKKILILTLVLFSLTITCAFAATTVEFTIDSTEYSVLKTEAEKSSLEAAPYIKNSRTMAPVRAILEAFDATVDWDDNTKTVFISKGETNISLAIGSNKIIVNGEEKAIDCPAEIVDGRTFIPLRAVTEVLGYYVYYVDATRQILIDDVAPVMSVNGVDVPYNVYHAFYTFNTELDEQTGLPVRDESLSLEIYEYLSLLFAHYSKSQDAIPGLSEQRKEEIRAECANLMSSGEKGKYVVSGSLALFFEKYLVAENNYSIAREFYKNSVSDDTARDYYRSNFVLAKHVLISTETRTEKEALSIANEVYKKAIANENFDGLILQYGEDPGTVQNTDGYIFTRGEMVKEFEDAAFSLPVGSISKPVKTAFGYHIILRLELREDPEILESIKESFAFLELQKYVDGLYKNAVVSTNYSPYEALYL